MSRRPALLLLVAFAAAALLAAERADAKRRTIRVANEQQFQRAERKLARTGGTIVLRPRLYRRLSVGSRSRRPLRIVGTRGTRVEDVYLYGTQKVSLGHVTIGPIRGDALVEVWHSRDIAIHDVTLRGRGRLFAKILLGYGKRLTVRDSDLAHCSVRAPDFVNCVTLYRWTHDVLIEGNRFHDCTGCDFVNGRFGTRLTIRGNTFDRALPCSMGWYRCRHNDLVQLFAGRRLRVEGNRFGIYRDGGAQLYLTDRVDYATVVNNVFRATDPRVPGYRARMGIVVGSNASRRLPHYARIVNNTILSGSRRRDGYAGSIRMSSRYGGVPRWMRPIVANNVLALLETPGRVCGFSQRFLNNVVLRGRNCAEDGLVGPVALDGRGRPREGSPLIDGANRHFAPARDATGRSRDDSPDIGAYEFRAPK